MSVHLPTPTPEQVESAVWPGDAFHQEPENTFQQRLIALLECTGATYRQIERGTRGVVSKQTIWQFRSGRSKNPSYKVIAALSAFFNIPASYFFGERCDEDIAYLLPCLPKAEREHIQAAVVELLEQQLCRFGRQLRAEERPAPQQECES
ncbi:MAG: hypothetical protein ACOYYS_17670 [Chloroflexota bacterium]